MSKLKDLTGQRFGRLVVLYKVKNKKAGTYWHCVCDCGNEKDIAGTSLKSGATKSCGCLLKETLNSQYIDLTGKRFGKLTVIQKDEKKSKPKKLYWLCECDCGNKTTVLGACLKNGDTKSCGCLHSIQARINGLSCKKYNSYDLSGEYGVGYTTKGEEFYFDLEDYEKIKDYCWCLDKNGYVNSPNSIKMHRLVTNCNDFYIVDHKNHIQYDNRKENLRLVTHSQNAKNRKSKGFVYNKKSNMWESYINVNHKRIYLGSFKEKRDAITAKRIAEDKYFGEYSYSNSMKNSPNV